MEIKKGISDKELILELIGIPKEDIEEFIFDNPVVLKQPVAYNDSSEPNATIDSDTSLTITAKADSKKYKNSFVLRYRRINIERQLYVIFLSKILNWKYNSNMIPDTSFNERTIWQYVLQFLNINESAVDKTITITGNRAIITITPKQNNLLFVGGSVVINLEPLVRATDISLLNVDEIPRSFEYQTTINLGTITLESLTP